MTEAQIRALQRYRKKIVRLTVNFCPTEMELVEQINKQPAKQTYIKDLIRADITRGKKEEK